MKNAFINQVGVLVAIGFMETNNDDQKVEVDDDFELQPGRWRLSDGQWLPYEPDPTVPAMVTMRQARLALLAAGKLAAVDLAIAALPTPQKEAAQIEWDYAAIVERGSPIVALLGPALNLDEAALDELFQEAALR